MIDARDIVWTERFDARLAAGLLELFRAEWWSKGRSAEQTERLLAHSDVTLGCLDRTGDLIGFARVLTDYTFKAMIFDVIVRHDLRHAGLGSRIIEHLFAHPDLADVQNFELYCPDRLVPFYDRLGFRRGTAQLLFRETGDS